MPFSKNVINQSVTGTTHVVTGPGGLLPGAIALTQHHILVGNSQNVAADVAMTGEVTITDAGETTVDAVSANTAGAIVRRGEDGAAELSSLALRAATNQITLASGSNETIISSQNYGLPQRVTIPYGGELTSFALVDSNNVFSNLNAFQQRIAIHAPDNQIMFGNGSGLVLTAPNNGVSKAVTLQDKAGTIALLSDIEGGSGTPVELPQNQIFQGNISGVATAYPVTGELSLAGGVATVSASATATANSIVRRTGNADIAASKYWAASGDGSNPTYSFTDIPNAGMTALQVGEDSTVLMLMAGGNNALITPGTEDGTTHITGRLSMTQTTLGSGEPSLSFVRSGGTTSFFLPTTTAQYTFPPASAAEVVITEGDQTISGTKTFAAALLAPAYYFTENPGSGLLFNGGANPSTSLAVDGFDAFKSFGRADRPTYMTGLLTIDQSTANPTASSMIFTRPDGQIEFKIPSGWGRYLFPPLGIDGADLMNADVIVSKTDQTIEGVKTFTSHPQSNGYNTRSMFVPATQFSLTGGTWTEVRENVAAIRRTRTAGAGNTFVISQVSPPYSSVSGKGYRVTSVELIHSVGTAAASSASVGMVIFNPVNGAYTSMPHTQSGSSMTAVSSRTSTVFTINSPFWATGTIGFEVNWSMAASTVLNVYGLIVNYDENVL